MKNNSYYPKNNFQLYVLLMSMFFVSCKKFVEIDAPKNSIVTSSTFSDSANATSAVLGIYNSIMQFSSGFNFASGGTTIYTGLSSDEIYSTRGIVDESQFYKNSVSPINNNTASAIWNNAYTFIYDANACIEGLSKATNLSNLLKNQLLGESKVLRAFFYFNLVNLYGAVPLVTSTDYKVNGSLPRSDTSIIYQQITQDLIDAQNLLREEYVTNGRVRINKYTATALLAKVYLYQKQWQNAEIAAAAIINNPSVYSLVTDLNNVFLSSSREAIWQLLPLQTGYETPEGFVFIPTSTSVKPKYIISDFLLNAFEVGDQRKSKWVKANTVSGVLYNYPYKYKLGKDNNTTPIENYMVFRLGEQYLIRAEARAQQNKLTEAAADLNIIRNRAGLLNTTASTQLDLLTAIAHERQVELFLEWGNRWYDLKRTGMVNTVMDIVTPTKGGIWNANWQLYPIPFSQIQLNPFLNQNIGY